MPRKTFHGSGLAWLPGFKMRRKHAFLLQEVSISDDDVEKHRHSSLAAVATHEGSSARSSPSHNKRTRKEGREEEGMNVEGQRHKTTLRFGHFMPFKDALTLLEVSLQGEKIISQPTQTCRHCRGMGRIGGYHQQAAQQKESQLLHQ